MTRWPLTWALLALFQLEDVHGHGSWKYWQYWRSVDSMDLGRGAFPSVWD